MSLLFSSPQNQVSAGFHYFIKGWSLLAQKKFLPFVIIPLIINVLLIIGLSWFFLSSMNHWVELLLPSWLDWISFILIPLVFVLLLVSFYFAFTTLANFIAAPFNALLSEKVELQLTNQPLGDTSLFGMLKDIPRMLKREWQKMMYSVPRLIALFFLGFVPVLGQTAVPVLAFIFGAWMVAIQYCDYPFDNHKISFPRMRNALSQNKWMNYTFGTLVSLFTMIPFVNFVVMPIAVCGATAMWVEEYRQFFLDNATGEFERKNYTFSTARKKDLTTHSGNYEVK